MNTTTPNFTRKSSFSSILKTFSLIACFATVTACGSNFDMATRLADDPETEQDQQLPQVVPPVIPETPEVPEEEPAPPVGSARDQILKLYDYVDPNKVIPTDALETVILYFHDNKASIKNQNFLSVIDFRKKSTLHRFFIINMKTGSVKAMHTAHGKGSDSDHDGYAESFSNKSGSNASSVGFYKAAESYQGKYGLSLRLDGLSSTNSKARARAVVIHAADYVKEQSVIQGRSWGCPAVAKENRDYVVNSLKNGSIIYAVGK